MGQYYKIGINRTDDLDSRKTAYYYPEMLKLMEFSWLTNWNMNWVESLLKTPAVIVWVGDYADQHIKEPRNTSEKITSEFDASTEDRIFTDSKGGFLHAFNDDGCPEAVNCKTRKTCYAKYLINLTKKEFIDIEHYKNEFTNKDDFCIHPLPLLTAVGNGLGGGDYHGINMEFVGIWAGDTIQTLKAQPDSTFTDMTAAYGFM